jgi:hypothetical protein
MYRDNIKREIERDSSRESERERRYSENIFRKQHTHTYDIQKTTHAHIHPHM